MPVDGGWGILRIVLLNCFLLQCFFIVRESLLQRAGSSSDLYSKVVGGLDRYLDLPTSLPQRLEPERVSTRKTFPSLQELVGTNNATASHCKRQLIYMADIDLPTKNVTSRKIPKIVHVTGKTRCLSKSFYDNLNKWKFQDHSFYFHDEEAMDRLLQESWPEFPQLQHMQHCLISGAAKADLWRYLLLYKYGGIYTDMDNAPTKDFFVKDKNGSPTNTTIITDDDDTFFVVERIGVLSQYFMASSPKHPLLYLSVLQVFARLMDVEAIGTQYVPFVTGPGALKNAFIRFMGLMGGGQVKEGRYVGHNNHTVTVVGSKRHSNKYVQRESINGAEKRNGYSLMGMKHFGKSARPSLNVSCFLHLYDNTIL